MKKNIFLNENYNKTGFNKTHILIAMILSAIILAVDKFLIYSFFIVPIILLYIRFDIKTILNISLILMLTVTSSLGEEIRLAVQLFSYGVFGIYFLSRFGFEIRRYPKLPSEIILFLAFYFLSIIISFIFSDFQRIGFDYISRILLFFQIAYLVYCTIENEDSIKKLIIVVFLVASIISLSIFYELALNNFNFLDFEISMYFRSGGLIPNVNAAAGLFAISFPIAVVLLFGDFDKKIKNILKVFIIIIFIGIILSNSRAAYISLIISISFILFNLKRRLFNYVLIGLFLLALIFFVIPPLNEFLTLFLRLQDGISYREYLWKLSLDIINDNWVFGVGPGAFGQVMFKYFPVMLDSWQGVVFKNLFDVTNAGNVSHNFYLGFFAELGMLGLITSILLPIIFFRIAVQTIRWYKKIRNNYYFLTLGITSVGLGLFVRANLDNVSIITNGYITTDLPFWIVFSILIFIFLQSKKEQGIIKNCNKF